MAYSYRICFPQFCCQVAWGLIEILCDGGPNADSFGLVDTSIIRAKIRSVQIPPPDFQASQQEEGDYVPPALDKPFGCPECPSETRS